MRVSNWFKQKPDHIFRNCFGFRRGGGGGGLNTAGTEFGNSFYGGALLKPPPGTGRGDGQVQQEHWLICQCQPTGIKTSQEGMPWKSHNG